MIRRWQVITNRVVNTAGIVAVVVASGSGLAIVLGSGEEANVKMPGLLGFSRESWMEFHEPAAVVFVLVVLLHIIMHWRQVLARCKQCIHKPQFLLSEHTVILLAILLVILTAVADIEEPEDERFETKALHRLVDETSVPKAHCTAGFIVIVAVLVHSGRQWCSLRSLR